MQKVCTNGRSAAISTGSNPQLFEALGVLHDYAGRTFCCLSRNYVSRVFLNIDPIQPLQTQALGIFRSFKATDPSPCIIPEL